MESKDLSAALLRLPRVKSQLDTWPERKRTATTQADDSLSSTQPLERLRKKKKLVTSLTLFAFSAEDCTSHYWAKINSWFLTRSSISSRGLSPEEHRRKCVQTAQVCT